MTPQLYLASLSRDFLALHGVHRWHMKAVSDLDDAQVITACHHFCEENRLTASWEEFRCRREADLVYCPDQQEYIEPGLCCDLQMMADGLITPSQPIDCAALLAHCAECPHRL